MNSECLFCKMVSGEVAVEKLYDDAELFAIRDINPRAPIHILVIPKTHIADARGIEASAGNTLAHMFATARALAEQDGIGRRGYRLAFNVGEDAGMTVSHLHMHVLGGRHLGAEG